MVTAVKERPKSKDLHEIVVNVNKERELILQIQNVSIYYGQKQAVRSINMDIEKNSITALIGPSGCGKSTFLRSINRMNDLIEGARCEGTIKYDGINILDEQIDVVALRKEIGMVFQKPNPFPKSIYDNIAHGLRFSGIRKKSILDGIIEESLRRAAIWDEVKDRLHKSALSLSGGQQQRLCIARTIAMNPAVLLLDEPSSALDPISNGKIEELLIELKKEYSIVIVTHNMQQASRISDRTAFFLNGDLIEYDKTNKVFTNPSEKKTEEYITGRFG
ncbi:phosphate ABC transporter ATP-binding protein [Bacillus aquiflavi]|uniref:Phosphate ABC transporter ATP-binding protein n=1 Tax=Bacillus aquiflavi TaxID=2672567 RepID=A0A6B3VXW8_9BACI|nr:phosphate ABC transporter ATP-binding protein PstB [Bacillus aquiflavi]MBA4535829.1 phosphate ABC transporter ATP-binding protein [Bacillus aquiflavi]NEY80204.1 phosphate ABC transporter ATP-binding protein [Bacillus aquiflavi]UAC47256.1 phosphate ABC transporter ATP-binding protein PstB [Bacillus aquiflavi]